jgi:phytoene dehydrogenase-like protein
VKEEHILEGPRQDAIIVGGGHNGLVAAFYLARAGLKVTVLERRGFVGGACATEELFDGYRVSSCSYVLWMLQSKVMEDMQLRRRGLEYKVLDPIQFNPYKDGSYAFFWMDEARTQQELRRLNEHDARTYPEFNKFWSRAASLVNHFLLKDPPTLAQVMDHAREKGEEQLLEWLLTHSVADACDAYFEDTRVKAAVVQVEDTGDPWTPGSAWPEAYFHCSEFTDLGGYAVVTGGMGAVTAAMARACREQGVQIRTDAEVEEILVDDGRVRGARLASGEEMEADLVLSNADPKRTLLKLTGPHALPADFRAQVENLSTKTSYLKFHAVMDRLPDTSRYLGREPEPREVSYIHIAPSLEHYRKAHDEIVAGEPASEPIVHMQVPTPYDSTLTDRDGQIVSIWALFAPPKLARGTWEERREEVGNALIDYVAELIPNFRKDMREWQLFTPADMEQRVGLTNGNIRHLDVVPGQFMSQRPMPMAGSNYSTPIEGLYLCGAGTHPAGEVSGAPGHNAAHAVLREVEAKAKKVAS